MLTTLKRAAEKIPEPVGKLLVRVPFSLRLGRHYTAATAEIRAFEGWSGSEREAFIFRRVERIVAHALRHNPFYRWFYGEHGFSLATLKAYEDIPRIPIVRKADLRAWNLEQRTNDRRGRLRVNTGGTSGEPLEFYLSKDLFAREWAHMHTVWGRLGYRQTDAKLTFRGENLGSEVIRYNPVHNEYVVNAYRSHEEAATEIRRLLSRTELRYLHGYPSTVYEFARYCDREAVDLRDRLRRTLRGALLGSEFPAPPYRSVIEEAFQIPTLSWYGHSEMAVFAYERDAPFRYTPMQTYGFAEASKMPDGGYHLIGTSYENWASPFIRYDTGDLIAPTQREGMLESFEITDGRIGEFVLDRKGQPISLTAFIFGRHHDAFAAADFIQVQQRAPGRVLLLVVPVMGNKVHNWVDLFDLGGVDLDVEIRLAEAPYRTSAGKAPLLIPDASAGPEAQPHAPCR